LVSLPLYKFFFFRVFCVSLSLFCCVVERLTTRDYNSGAPPPRFLSLSPLDFFLFPPPCFSIRSPPEKRRSKQVPIPQSFCFPPVTIAPPPPQSAPPGLSFSPDRDKRFVPQSQQNFPDLQDGTFFLTHPNIDELFSSSLPPLWFPFFSGTSRSAGQSVEKAPTIFQTSPPPLSVLPWFPLRSIRRLPLLCTLDLPFPLCLLDTTPLSASCRRNLALFLDIVFFLPVFGNFLTLPFPSGFLSPRSSRPKFASISGKQVFWPVGYILFRHEPVFPSRER